MIRNRIAIVRKCSDMKQETLAQSLGVTKQTVSNWENNKRQPSAQQIWKLMHIFSCDFYELFTDNP